MPTRDPEKNRAKVKAWRLANPEKVKAHKRKYKAAWAKRNPEKARAKQAAKIARNGDARSRYSPEKLALLADRAAVKYAADPVKFRAASAAWARENPGAKKVHRLTRRALEGSQPCTLTPTDMKVLVDMSNGLCAYCLTAPATDLEHVQPVSRGGAHAYENLVMACRSCNARKGALTALEFFLKNNFSG